VALTSSYPLKTRETVATETPLSFETSRIVAISASFRKRFRRRSYSGRAKKSSLQRILPETFLPLSQRRRLLLRDG
jgi:hypothetical protein